MKLAVLQSILYAMRQRHHFADVLFLLLFIYIFIYVFIYLFMYVTILIYDSYLNQNSYRPGISVQQLSRYDAYKRL